MIKVLFTAAGVIIAPWVVVYITLFVIEFQKAERERKAQARHKKAIASAEEIKRISNTLIKEWSKYEDDGK